MHNIQQELEERLTTVRQKLAEWEVEGVYISRENNRRWLSGFTGSTGWLLVTADQAILATDSRYWEQAAAEMAHFELYKLNDYQQESLNNFLLSTPARRLGLEAHHVTLSHFDSLSEIEEIEWVRLKETVEPLRAVKSPSEVEMIRRAAAITDQAMAAVNELARPGMTEGELAWELEKLMRENGADGLSFPIIVAAGVNGARAHHRAGSRPLQIGDALVIDMGAVVDGYCSDLTRSFYLGSRPDEKFWEIYNLVLQAQTTALREMKAGMNSKTADALARDVIEAAGYGSAFGHSLGHGVGLNIHEAPRVSFLADDATLPANSVITVEPGVYLPDWGGVRIEDLVLLTEAGPELLSHCPKEPIIPA